MRGRRFISLLGKAGGSIVIPASTFNWVAEGDSITVGLGGQPSYPFVALAALPGASITTVTPNVQATSPLSGGGNITLRDIATSGISALTINANYSTRAGAQFQAGQVNVLSLLIGTNTSGASDTSAAQKYAIIRAYIKQALVTGYARAVVSTLTARDDDGGTLWNTVLTPLNALIRSAFNSDLQCDGLIDFGNDPHFNSTTAAQNLAFYTNIPPAFLHPNVAGEAVMGGIALPSIISALQGPGAKTFAPATWSPCDGNNTLPNLSNGNRTVTAPGGTADFAQRGWPGARSGKIYFEMDCTSGGGFSAPAIVNDSFPFNNAAWPGFDAAGNAIIWGGGGVITKGNVSQGTLAPSYVTSDNLGMAADFTNKLLWCRVNHLGTVGNWNLGGTANPTTGVGGISFSSIPLAGAFDRFYPAVAMNTGTDQALSRFAASQMLQPIPSGFSTFA